jgi:hypothetical protein
MSSRNKRDQKRKLRSLRAENRYLREALKNIKEELTIYESEWNCDFNFLISKFSNNTIVENNKKLDISRFDRAEQAHCDEEKLEKVNKNNAPAWAKSLYKKIARKTHPDKIKNKSDIKRMSEIFQEATKIMETQNHEKLFDIALEIGVTTDLNESEMVEKMSLMISRLRGEIHEIEKSIEWIWGESFGIDNIRLKVAKAALVSKGLTVDDNILLSYIKNIENNSQD